MDQSQISSLTNTFTAIMIGPVAGGKSMLIGQLLYQLGAVPEKIKDKLLTEAEMMGRRREAGWSFLVDKLKSERERGQTIRSKRKYIKLPISRRSSLEASSSGSLSVALIDTPGAPRYLKNVITPLTQANCAVLVIRHCGENKNFSMNETYIIDVLTLSYGWGIRNIIVVFTDFKTSTINLNQKSYYEDILNKCGYTKNRRKFVAVNFTSMENISSEASSEASFQEALQSAALESVIAKRLSKTSRTPLILTVCSTHKLSGIGTVIAGQIQSGVLEDKMEVRIMPSGLVTQLKDLYHFQQRVEQVVAGETAGFAAKGLARSSVQQGDIVTLESNTSTHWPIHSFVGQIKVIHSVGKSGFGSGYCPLLDIHVKHTTCKVELLRINNETCDATTKASKGDRVLLRVTPKDTVCALPYSECQGLGVFALRDRHQLIAVGIVISVS